MELSLSQLMVGDEGWASSSLLVQVEAGIQAGSISRKMVTVLTPDFLGSTATDEALVAVIPKAAILARHFYVEEEGALRDFLTRQECRRLDAWLAAELAWLTPIYVRLEEEAERRAAHLRSLPGLLRSHLRSRVLPLELARVLRAIYRAVAECEAQEHAGCGDSTT